MMNTEEKEDSASEQHVSGSPVPIGAQCDHVLMEWNDTLADFSQDKCVHQLFEALVEQRPDALAVVFPSTTLKQLTYRELNQRANQLAHHLRKLGVGPEVLVGICMERSLEMVVGILGVLKAGGAYVPLDPSYPKERLGFMLEDAQVSVLLTQQRLAADRPIRNPVVVCLDADRKIISDQRDENLSVRMTPDNLAYVIYTSGSTGRPKGVQVSHRSVVDLFAATRPLFHFHERDVWTVVHSYAFDFSVWEIWGSLLHGGRLVVVPHSVIQSPAALYDLLHNERVTILSQTPSALRQLIEAKKTAADAARDLSLRLIVCGGEALPRGVALSSLEWGVPVWNFYGPTEATVWASMNEVELANAKNSSIPIGRPLASTQIYLLNSKFHLVPIGVPGELFIGGTGLARGYLKRPDLTAEKFAPNPFSEEPGARLYKTGDLGRYLPDGNVEFLGRIDHQVKIRGFRIELGEVETVLSQHPAVREMVVQARQDAGEANRLVAYVVPHEDSVPSTSELRIFLKARLPDYMVPSAFVFLDSLPLTPNGKVDRKALPEPDQTRPELERAFIAPSTHVEEGLAGIWAEVLGLDRVGVEDNFFDLGGHSLNATRIISRVRDTFQIELPMRSIFENSTVGDMAKMIEEDSHAERNPQPSLIQAIQQGGNLPLSFSQERVWFIQQLEPANVAYNFQATLRLTGQLDVAALEQSLGEIVRRHEIYRTTFPAVDGRPVQVVHPAEPVKLPVIDLQALEESEREAAATRLFNEEIQKSFELTCLPLIRWTLLRLSERNHVLIHVEHHLVHDGWSFNVFLYELLELYKALSVGHPSPLPDLPIKFADFAVWQRQWMQGEEAEAQTAYWKKQLAGSPPVVELPFDHPRPAVQTFRGAAPRFEIPLDLCASLRALSRRERTTLFVTMLTGFVTLLYRYSGQEDICVGTGMANRRWRETEGLIGMIINNIVLRADLSGNPTVRQLLGRVRETTLQGCAHQDLPFDKVVEALQPVRSLSHNPLFQVVFSFHDAPMPDLDIPGLSLNLGLVLSNRSAKFDLNVIVIPHSEQRIRLRPGAEGDGLTVIWEHNSDLFDDTTIARMAGYYQTLLEGMVANPDQHISEITLLTKPERRQLLVEWNNTQADYSKGKCIHQLFEEQAERTPDSIAVAYENQQLTYSELNCRANQLAHYLQGLGVGPETPVAICMERTPDMVTGLLGILKAGGAYLPLDPTYPSDRLAFMLEDAQAPVLLTQQRLLKDLHSHGVKACCIDSDWGVISQESQANPQHEAGPGNLAYVIYTSGSTGLPKGVGIHHAGLVNLVAWHQREYSVTPADRATQLAAPAFDASVWELWPYLTAGASIHIPDEETRTSPSKLLEWLVAEGITICFLPTPLAEAVLEEQWPTRSVLRAMLTGGDKLHRRPRKVLPFCLINHYGPTESTVVATSFPVTADGDAEIPPPIGRPIANTQVDILDPHLQPVPIGVPGELHIGGPSLARGYLSRPELTAEKFIPNPFSDEPDARLYKTGDLARYLPDGNIEFLGRNDHQVKIRGFRIELGEIETVLADHPGVRQSVTMVREDEPGDPSTPLRTEKRLVAYVVARQGFAPTTSDLRGFLKDKLPEYMVPSAFVMLDALPLTPNGKVDRQALPVPDQSRPEQEAHFVPPSTAEEKTIAKIWAQVLKLDPVGIHDNFFDLGGHSLLATQVVSRLRRAFQVEISLRSLFEAPTVAGLAERIERACREQRGLQAPPLLPVPRDGNLPLSFAQQRL